ncbi:toxin-antitoxin system HicB family antitoxin [Rhodococcus triatomae]|uniref:HicB family protein n=1 Tax=Rhodococcus triatomae TaxID=300028 RepID=A0A1G8MZZ6_9NOCA|nr:toxin-antitoxin system HicB family antitoxin [Rhodococcus triatomae]QNG19138.1 toxin-antitoxin system HicB family antitoxin [Rhodococcus triatomae]QNG24950.1 toxin-antitoxin system HicB family antitoxin [Rhodococcus triatomae]SDI73397.1 HicB family protein [Rhodococcus triatomae]
MELQRYTRALHDDFAAAAALGDERTREVAAALAKALEPALRLQILAALGEFADTVSAQLPDRTLALRLDGDTVVVDVRADRDEAEEAAGPDFDDVAAAFEDVTGDISRVTLRLVEQLKTKAEEAASQNGVSLNSWVSQAVQGALRDQMRRAERGYRPDDT